MPKERCSKLFRLVCCQKFERLPGHSLPQIGNSLNRHAVAKCLLFDVSAVRPLCQDAVFIVSQKMQL